MLSVPTLEKKTKTVTTLEQQRAYHLFCEEDTSMNHFSRLTIRRVKRHLTLKILKVIHLEAMKVELSNYLVANFILL